MREIGELITSAFCVYGGLLDDHSPKREIASQIVDLAMKLQSMYIKEMADAL